MHSRLRGLVRFPFLWCLRHYNYLLFIIIPSVADVHVILKKIECNRRISTKRSQGTTERRVYTLVFHQSKCINAMRRILSTVETYIRLHFFMYLYVRCYCDACLKSSALHEGMKTLHNTLYLGWPTRRSQSTIRSNQYFRK